MQDSDYDRREADSIREVEEVIEESGPGGSGDILEGFPKATGAPPTSIREESETEEDRESGGEIE